MANESAVFWLTADGMCHVVMSTYVPTLLADPASFVCPLEGVRTHVALVDRAAFPLCRSSVHCHGQGTVREISPGVCSCTCNDGFYGDNCDASLKLENIVGAAVILGNVADPSAISHAIIADALRLRNKFVKVECAGVYPFVVATNSNNNNVNDDDDITTIRTECTIVSTRHRPSDPFTHYRRLLQPSMWGTLNETIVAAIIQQDESSSSSSSSSLVRLPYSLLSITTRTAMTPSVAMPRCGSVTSSSSSSSSTTSSVDNAECLVSTVHDRIRVNVQSSLPVLRATVVENGPSSSSGAMRSFSSAASSTCRMVSTTGPSGCVISSCIVDVAGAANTTFTLTNVTYAPATLFSAECADPSVHIAAQISFGNLPTGTADTVDNMETDFGPFLAAGIAMFAVAAVLCWGIGALLYTYFVRTMQRAFRDILMGTYSDSDDDENGENNNNSNNNKMVLLGDEVETADQIQNPKGKSTTSSAALRRKSSDVNNNNINNNTSTSFELTPQQRLKIEMLVRMKVLFRMDGGGDHHPKKKSKSAASSSSCCSLRYDRCATVMLILGTLMAVLAAVLVIYYKTSYELESNFRVLYEEYSDSQCDQSLTSYMPRRMFAVPSDSSQCQRMQSTGESVGATFATGTCGGDDGDYDVSFKMASSLFNCRQSPALTFSSGACVPLKEVDPVAGATRHTYVRLTCSTDSLISARTDTLEALTGALDVFVKGELLLPNQRLLPSTDSDSSGDDGDGDNARTVTPYLQGATLKYSTSNEANTVAAQASSHDFDGDVDGKRIIIHLSHCVFATSADRHCVEYIEKRIANGDGGDAADADEDDAGSQGQASSAAAAALRMNALPEGTNVALRTALVGGGLPLSSLLPTIADVPIGHLFGGYGTTDMTTWVAAGAGAQRYYNIQGSAFDMGAQFPLTPDSPTDEEGYAVSMWLRADASTLGFAYAVTDAFENSDSFGVYPLDRLAEIIDSGRGGGAWLNTTYKVYHSLYVNGPGQTLTFASASPDWEGTKKVQQLDFDLREIGATHVMNGQWHHVAITTVVENSKVRAQIVIDGQSSYTKTGWSNCMEYMPQPIQSLDARPPVFNHISDRVTSGGLLIVGYLNGGVAHLKASTSPMVNTDFLPAGTQTMRDANPFPRTKTLGLGIALVALGAILLLIVILRTGSAISHAIASSSSGEYREASGDFYKLMKTLCDAEDLFYQPKHPSGKERGDDNDNGGEEEDRVVTSATTTPTASSKKKKKSKHHHNEEEGGAGNTNQEDDDNNDDNAAEPFKKYTQNNELLPIRLYTALEWAGGHLGCKGFLRLIEEVTTQSASPAEAMALLLYQLRTKDHDATSFTVEEWNTLVGNSPALDAHNDRSQVSSSGRRDLFLQAFPYAPKPTAEILKEQQEETQFAKYISQEYDGIDDLGQGNTDGFGESKELMESDAIGSAFGSGGADGGGPLATVVSSIVSSFQRMFVWATTISLPTIYNGYFSKAFAFLSVDFSMAFGSLPTIVTPIIQVVAGLAILGIIIYFLLEDDRAFETTVARYVWRRDDLEVPAEKDELRVPPIVPDSLLDILAQTCEPSGGGTSVPTLPVDASRRIDQFIGKSKPEKDEEDVSNDAELVVKSMGGVPLCLTKEGGRGNGKIVLTFPESAEAEANRDANGGGDIGSDKELNGSQQLMMMNATLLNDSSSKQPSTGVSNTTTDVEFAPVDKPTTRLHQRRHFRHYSGNSNNNNNQSEFSDVEGGDEMSTAASAHQIGVGNGGGEQTTATLPSSDGSNRAPVVGQVLVMSPLQNQPLLLNEGEAMMLMLHRNNLSQQHQQHNDDNNTNPNMIANVVDVPPSPSLHNAAAAPPPPPPPSLVAVGVRCYHHPSTRLTRLEQTEVWPLDNRPECCISTSINGRCGEDCGIIYSCGQEYTDAEGVQRVCTFGLCERHFRPTKPQHLLAVAHSKWRSFSMNGMRWAICTLFLMLLDKVYTPFMKTALMIVGCHPFYQCEFEECWSHMDQKFTFAVYLSFVVIGLLGIGYPLVLFLMLWRRRNLVEKVSVAEDYDGEYTDKGTLGLKASEWFRFISTDRTALASFYEDLRPSWIYLPSITIFMQVCTLIPAIFLEPRSWEQRMGCAAVQVAITLLVFVVNPFLTPISLLVMRVAELHLVLQLGLQSIDLVLINDGEASTASSSSSSSSAGGNADDPTTATTAVGVIMVIVTFIYILFSLVVLALTVAWPVLEAFIMKRRVRAILRTHGFHYTTATSLYVDPTIAVAEDVGISAHAKIRITRERRKSDDDEDDGGEADAAAPEVEGYLNGQQCLTDVFTPQRKSIVMAANNNGTAGDNHHDDSDTPGSVPRMALPSKPSAATTTHQPEAPRQQHQHHRYESDVVTTDGEGGGGGGIFMARGPSEEVHSTATSDADSAAIQHNHRGGRQQRGSATALHPPLGSSVETETL